MRVLVAAPHPGSSPRSGDADLVALARAGSDAALGELLELYRPLVRAKARSYFLAGADRDDVVQEAMIGLCKAVRDFDPERGIAFRTFADVCVTRQVVTAVRTASRHKHGPLNDSQSLAAVPGGPDRDARTAQEDDPADLVVGRERLRALQVHVDASLSDLEVRVLRLHLEGMPQADIADLLHRSSKSVDNALQRIKRKLSAHLAERTLAEAG
ncbi:MAG: polymerase sporulation specific sigma factor SigH [Frankiales bacterium]|nr:polymerase sporulation specific sigma factor SigH [Frankiales bacterium]